VNLSDGSLNLSTWDLCADDWEIYEECEYFWKKARGKHKFVLEIDKVKIFLYYDVSRPGFWKIRCKNISYLDCQIAGDVDSPPKEKALRFIRNRLSSFLSDINI